LTGAPSRSRLLLVSNRLSVAARVERGQLVVAPGAGGVANGLRDLEELRDGLWIGWPGETWRLTAEQRADLARRLVELRAVPVELTPTEVRRYYDGFCNAVLWPILHYQLERLPPDPGGWNEYRRVNERFAETVIEHYRPGDRIWVHDYQLMLVPGLIRQRLPNAPIGFFLHVPFPSSELFRVLRWRRALLEGMLGATVVGFHTASYASHFVSSAQRILGCPITDGRLVLGGRQIRVIDIPMGIDARAYAAAAERSEVLAEADRIRRDRPDVRLLVAVDRLDYTKGIPARLLAFERFLELNPNQRGRVQLVQVAAPSREGVGAYREIERDVNELVGRINGRFTTVGHAPIHYLSRTLPRDRVVALYRAASMALVTPLRDGMNLVAKEFAASRTDEDGVLILSEFAGAAAELAGSIVVNPYDLDGVAQAIAQALEMPREERRDRMRSLRARVDDHDVHRWARDFRDSLAAEHERMSRRVAAGASRRATPAAVATTILRRRTPLALILDYDGTLVPFHAHPDDARPDDEILQLLARLSATPATLVHISTGRRRAEIERWLGHLPIGLHAEHGAWSRSEDGSWTPRLAERPTWLERARSSMAGLVRRVPGSAIEEKETSVVWHYRNADPDAAERAAVALRDELDDALDSSDATVVMGARIIEVRTAGIHKGLIVDQARSRSRWGMGGPPRGSGSPVRTRCGSCSVRSLRACGLAGPDQPRPERWARKHPDDRLIAARGPGRAE
jgi:trehalose 6-phosphate synthase/phosphatase